LYILERNRACQPNLLISLFLSVSIYIYIIFLSVYSWISAAVVEEYHVIRNVSINSWKSQFETRFIRQEKRTQEIEPYLDSVWKCGQDFHLSLVSLDHDFIVKQKWKQCMKIGTEVMTSRSIIITNRQM
jgi:hypothetical protein